MGLGFPVYNSIVQNSVPPRDMASSITSLVFLRQIGGSIGVAIFGTLYTNYTTHYLNQGDNLRESYSKALHHVFLAALICALVGFIAAFGIKNVQLFNRKAQVIKNDSNKIDTTNNNNNNEEVEPQIMHAAMV